MNQFVNLVDFLDQVIEEPDKVILVLDLFFKDALFDVPN
ncbi:MAG: hypothetical protein A4E62_02733 [Syntrophorhabdus sp. PtaU1.Bin002]|nr:MAG: hypothetical protein A4E62_02733 [Syntrophorhabdus sp. PtaU1.Bin002]